MIRTPSGHLVDKFLSASFVDLMSHFCDTDTIAPCETEACIIAYNEWQAIPEWLVTCIIEEDLEAFEEVGGITFLRKTIAHLVKIAKAETDIQLDLVCELVLYLIGRKSGYLDWRDENGKQHYPDELFDFPEREALLDELRLEGDDDDVKAANEDLEEAFDSFFSLMIINEDEDGFVFWDYDFLFLLDPDVVEGIYKLYLICRDYDRPWHERPWRDIGEEVPDAIAEVLNKVDKAAEQCGGYEAMRRKIMEYAQKHRN